ncbi:kelch repeat-containing protein [Hydrogenophaga sp.]|uniref:Kelch repeat-containing protein n=1 Tax=Hydrogenophaga sp. TaxID=1904254 RepID=UPI002718480A|nr:kelch repeat-containing protein [Hydrogenophaga sp.]MDO9437313.1 kelch repeat-containing protein [Hydrogenophaga sp.]
MAPTSLSYDNNQPLYVVGEAITPNQARVIGGDGTHTFTVAPSLPAGLSLDNRSGVIAGTPTTLQRQASYAVSAGNGGGAAQTQIRVTVTARGAWSTITPSIPDARHYSSLTRLPDGRLLAAGGSTAGGGITASAHLYNPLTATWSPAASMLLARSDPMSVTLSDGRVLVYGGTVGGNNATAAAEIYDPGTDTWTATGSMAESRNRSTATLLGDGRVLVTGGYTTSPSLTFRNSVELYDPAAGTWSTLTAQMSVERGQHAAALLPGGSTLLLVGGVNRSGFVSTAELYAVDGTATTVIPYGGSGNVHQAVTLDDGSVLITNDGGLTAWRFDPVTSAWTQSTMGRSRALPTMTLLSDGRVLLAGGSSQNTAEIYNPDVNLWTAAAPMAAGRQAAVAALLGDGRVLVVGGISAGLEVDSTERYTP